MSKSDEDQNGEENIRNSIILDEMHVVKILKMNLDQKFVHVVHVVH